MGIKRALTVGILALLVLVGLSGADIAKDKEECANQLAGLATCLPYVSGTSKAPTPDCCTGLNQVLKTSKQCLCLLVKDRNDPSLGLKINATLALSLPLTCHAPASAASVTQCPALLHLPPNSPDAKVFYDFAKAAPSSNASTTVSSGKSGSGEASAAQTSSGSERWLEAKNQMVFAVFTLCFTSLLIFITPIN